jgi:hypothetical protein
MCCVFEGVRVGSEVVLNLSFAAHALGGTGR